MSVSGGRCLRTLRLLRCRRSSLLKRLGGRAVMALGLHIAVLWAPSPVPPRCPPLDSALLPPRATPRESSLCSSAVRRHPRQSSLVQCPHSSLFASPRRSLLYEKTQTMAERRGSNLEKKELASARQTKKASAPLRPAAQTPHSQTTRSTVTDRSTASHRRRRVSPPRPLQDTGQAGDDPAAVDAGRRRA